MASKQFAIPLDDRSKQSGDITFETLANAGTSATFQLTNIASVTSGNALNLKTRKNSQTKDHIFNVTISQGTAEVTLSASQLTTVYNDTNGGDWDFVEADWIISEVDTPDTSNQYELQGGNVYNINRWPPHS